MRDPTQVVWRRCFAFATEALIIALILVTTVYVAGDVQRRPSGCPDHIPAGRACVQYRSVGYLMRDRVFVWFVVALVVLVLLLVVLPQAVTGSTLGKAIFGVRAVRPDGSPPGVLRATIRTAAWLIDGLSVLLPIGLWVAMFSPGHRRVGDYLAGTYVVRRSAVGHPVPAAARHRRPR